MSHPVNNNKPVSHNAGIQPPKIQKDHPMLLGAEAVPEALGDTWKGEGFAQPLAVKSGAWQGELSDRNVTRNAKKEGSARKADHFAHKFFSNRHKPY